MIDSTNPRVMADNIRGLSNSQATQGEKIEALGTYSTDEINTGMKLGNDDIFRKIFEVELPNNTTKTFAHGISNLNKVIRFEGFVQYAPGVSGRQIATATSGFNSISYTASNIAMTTNTDLSGVTGIIIIEYTKSAAPTPDVTPSPDSDTRALEEREPESEPIEEKK